MLVQKTKIETAFPKHYIWRTSPSQSLASRIPLSSSYSNISLLFDTYIIYFLKSLLDMQGSCHMSSLNFFFFFFQKMFSENL
jgi:hypothetical protein